MKKNDWDFQKTTIWISNETTIVEQLKNFREKKKSEHSKKHLFLNVWKTWCDVKEIEDGIEENEPEKLN